MASNGDDRACGQRKRSRKPSSLQKLANVGEHDLIRLTEAPQLPELRGLLKASTLRREVKKGRLTVIEIANKHYVTRAAIREMIERCRAAVNRPISGFVQPDATNPERSPITQFGSSAREADRSEALVAALKIAKELSARLKTTSPQGEEPT